MPFTGKSGKFNAAIRTVEIGTGDKAVKLGGENVLPFYTFDAPIENAPKIGVLITDMGLENEVAGIKDYYAGATTFAEIAKKAEDVVEVQGESLENAEKVFAQIQSRFEELLSNLNEITGGIDTIAEAKSVTIDSIQSISAVSEETAASSEEVTETANRQLGAVEGLNTAAEDLLTNARHLSEAIDLFKI